MAPFPAPDPTPGGPAYEGRLLPDPAEEVVDQGLRFDIDTLVSRRHLVGLIGAGAALLGLAACTAPAGGAASGNTDIGTNPGDGAGTDAEIPEEMAGPFPSDGSNGPNILTESGIVRRDIRSSIDGSTTAAGVPMTLRLRLIDLANGGAPLAGAAVYAWQCDGRGDYSMYSAGLEQVTYLRGVQVAGEDGVVVFDSIFPGCYPGRWPHVHFEVYGDLAGISSAENAIATSQVALPKDASRAVYATADYPGAAVNLDRVTLRTDLIFGEDLARHQLAAVEGDVESGYRADLDVRIDTHTEPARVPTAGPMPGRRSSR